MLDQIHNCKERISSQTMETFFLRFPHLTEKIFGSVFDEELKECKEVSREWYSYLSQQKFLQVRMIQSYIESHFHEVGEAWKSVFKTLNSENIIHLGNAVKNVYGNESLPLRARRLNPLQVVASEGKLELFKCMIEKVEDIDQSYNSVTPLHFAARNGHLDLCQFIMEKVENKKPKGSQMWHHTPSSCCY